MDPTKYGDISVKTAGYLIADMLQNAQDRMIFERFGVRATIPKNSSRTAIFRRMLPLADAVAPVADGITPSGQKMRIEDIVVSLEEYADVVPFTNRVIDNAESPVIKQLSVEMSAQAVRSIERMRFGTLCGGTNVFYAGDVGSRSLVNSPPVKGELAAIERALERAGAEPITQMISPTAMVATEPVAEAYFAVCHTDLRWDISQIPDFTPVEKYSMPGKRLPGEFGKVGNIRFIGWRLANPFAAIGASGTTYLSNQSVVSGAASCDVYPILIFGQNSYGICPLQGEDSLSVSIFNPKKTLERPLGNLGCASWSSDQTCKILAEPWFLRYEVACTAKPTNT